MMSIHAIKGVEIGDGFATAARRGSQAHDEIEPGPDGVRRLTNRAGGIEGGMSTGEPIRVRAAMKPISTVPRALATVDVRTGEPAKAINQRSDVTAVPAAGVVAEAMAALVLADAVLEKFGGDSVAETRRNFCGYLENLVIRMNGGEPAGAARRAGRDPDRPARGRQDHRRRAAGRPARRRLHRHRRPGRVGRGQAGQRHLHRRRRARVP